MGNEERRILAEKRLTSILRKYKIASARTLEQKISDAGPFPQRIDPHVLTPVRRGMEQENVIGKLTRSGSGSTPWYYLTETDSRIVNQKLGELVDLHERAYSRDTSLRVGQALEIAVQRALQNQNTFEFFGWHNDVDNIDDSNLYKKTEPPNRLSGNSLDGNQNLDFLIEHNSIYGGIEIKNTREWLYPDRNEIQEFLMKCCQLNVVPILIARRIPFVTFKLLNSCGAIVHQTYRQHYPTADSNLVESLKDKNLFGFHDIVLGNQPDARLNKFIHTNLPSVLPQMKARFDEYIDITQRYGNGEIKYREFAARVRRRAAGTNEDND